eukprot:Clim_evm39s239 gene=Clim_evmTU39s239
MKFGKRFLYGQNPDLADKYVNYKDLKHTLKTAGNTDEERALVVAKKLDGDIAKCYAFVIQREKLLSQVIRAALNSDSDDPGSSPVSAENLLRVKADLEILAAFGHMNALAVSKIWKKVEKKLGQNVAAHAWAKMSSSTTGKKVEMVTSPVQDLRVRYMADTLRHTELRRLLQTTIHRTTTTSTEPTTPTLTSSGTRRRERSFSPMAMRAAGTGYSTMTRTGVRSLSATESPSSLPRAPSPLDMSNSVLPFVRQRGGPRLPQMSGFPYDAEAADLLGTPLHRLAAMGDTDAVAAMLNDGITMQFGDQPASNPYASMVAQVDVEGRTPLHWASRNGHADVMRLLVTSSTNGIDAYGHSALHYAVREGHQESLRVLLDAYGPDDGGRGKQLLVLACLLGRLEILQMLLDSRREMGLDDPLSAATMHNSDDRDHIEEDSLVMATCAGSSTNAVAVLRYLLDDSPEPWRSEAQRHLWSQFRGSPSKRHTALTLAALSGQRALVNLLLRRTPKEHLAEIVNARNAKGETALSLALYRGHLGTARQLLAIEGIDKGAGMDIKAFAPQLERKANLQTPPGLDSEEAEFRVYFGSRRDNAVPAIDLPSPTAIDAQSMHLLQRKQCSLMMHIRAGTEIITSETRFHLMPRGGTQQPQIALQSDVVVGSSDDSDYLDGRGWWEKQQGKHHESHRKQRSSVGSYDALRTRRTEANGSSTPITVLRSRHILKQSIGHAMADVLLKDEKASDENAVPVHHLRRVPEIVVMVELCDVYGEALARGKGVVRPLMESDHGEMEIFLWGNDMTEQGTLTLSWILLRPFGYTAHLIPAIKQSLQLSGMIPRSLSVKDRITELRRWLCDGPGAHVMYQELASAWNTNKDEDTVDNVAKSFLPVIGHRGAGALKDAVVPQTGTVRTHFQENTLLSFATAAYLGASYVELDVQLSRDFVPIVHHDFTLPLRGGEGGDHKPKVDISNAPGPGPDGIGGIGVAGPDRSGRHAMHREESITTLPELAPGPKVVEWKSGALRKALQQPSASFVVSGDEVEVNDGENEAQNGLAHQPALENGATAIDHDLARTNGAIDGKEPSASQENMWKRHSVPVANTKPFEIGNGGDGSNGTPGKEHEKPRVSNIPVSRLDAEDFIGMSEPSNVGPRRGGNRGAGHGKEPTPGAPAVVPKTPAAKGHTEQDRVLATSDDEDSHALAVRRRRQNPANKQRHLLQNKKAHAMKLNHHQHDQRYGDDDEDDDEDDVAMADAGAQPDTGTVEDKDQTTYPTSSPRSSGQPNRGQRLPVATGSTHTPPRSQQRNATGKAKAAPVKARYIALREALRDLPISVGLDIEVKCPVWEEFLENDLDIPFINRLVDAILLVIAEEESKRGPSAPQRRIFFSTFNAEVALALAKKQRRYPVLYLTSSGTDIYGDTRMNSLRDAAHFAAEAGLAGIVARAWPLLQFPVLIGKIQRGFDLSVLTWGKENNEQDMVALQRRFGIDAVVVDHVQHIHSSLK